METFAVMERIKDIFNALTDGNLTIAERLDLAASLVGMGNHTRSFIFGRFIS